MVSIYLIAPVGLSTLVPKIYEEISGKNINNTVVGLCILILYSFLLPIIAKIGVINNQKTKIILSVMFILLITMFVLMSRVVNKQYLQTGNILIAVLIPAIIYMISYLAAKKQDEIKEEKYKAITMLAPLYSVVIVVLFLLIIIRKVKYNLLS
jgi:hypothetical protein